MTRRRPGSPWMPTPISISSSPSVKVGLPAAGTVQLVSATPIERVRPLTRSPSAFSAARSPPLLGRGADDLLDDQRAGDPAPPGAIGRVLDRDVVVGQDRLDSRPSMHLAGHLEIHHVAGVVLDDEQHAGAAVDRLRRRDHLVGRRRGEDLARTGRVEHAAADEAGVQRLVAAAAAGDQRDLARRQLARGARTSARPERDDVGMRGGEAVEALGEQRHGDSSASSSRFLPDFCFACWIAPPTDPRQSARRGAGRNRRSACRVRWFFLALPRSGRPSVILRSCRPSGAARNAPRMRRAIGGEERRPLRRREMADLEDERRDAAPGSASDRPGWRSARRSCGSCRARRPAAGACPTGGCRAPP